MLAQLLAMPLCSDLPYAHRLVYQSGALSWDGFLNKSVEFCGMNFTERDLFLHMHNFDCQTLRIAYRNKTQALKKQKKIVNQINRNQMINRINTNSPDELVGENVEVWIK